MAAKAWHIGRAVFDPDGLTVTHRQGQPITLRAQSAQVLQLLLEHRGEVVEKPYLHDKVWGDSVVTDDSLVQCIADIRRALGEERSQLQTVRKRGYRLRSPAPTRSPPQANHRRSLWLWGGILLSLLLLTSVLWFKRTPPQATLMIQPFTHSGEAQRWSRLARALGQDLQAVLAANLWLKVVDTRQSGASQSRFQLTGTLTTVERDMAVSVNLIDRRDGAVVWSRQWREATDEYFTLRDQLIADVVGELSGRWSGRLASHSRHRALNRSTENLEAYELYLLAGQEKHRFSLEGYQNAERYLLQAVQLDAQFSEAWSTLAILYNLQVGFAKNTAEVAHLTQQRKAATQKAYALTPESAAALMQVNWLRAFEGDSEGAKRAVLRAVELAANNADVLAQAAWLGPRRSDLGELPKSWVQRAKTLRAHWPPWYAMGAATSAFATADYAGVVAALEAAPKSYAQLLYLGVSQALLGDLEQARTTAQALRQGYPHFDLVRYLWAEGYRNPDYTRRLLEGARLLALPVNCTPEVGDTPVCTK